jgi:hypothetical protein
VTEERTRPHLPTVRALQDVAALVTELYAASVNDKTALRMHQLRTAFAEIIFGLHTIRGARTQRSAAALSITRTTVSG